jgi:hypothetical protein
MLEGFNTSNFKAFGDPVRVRVRPITLVFGANSSGKSSLLHSLVLLKHIVDGGESDVHEVAITGDTIDLGGFAQYVHAGMESEPVAWTVYLAGNPMINGTHVGFSQGRQTGGRVTLRKTQTGDSDVIVETEVFGDDGMIARTESGPSKWLLQLGTSGTCVRLVDDVREALRDGDRQAVVTNAELSYVLSYLLDDLRSPQAGLFGWEGQGAGRWRDGYPPPLFMVLNAHLYSTDLQTAVRAVLDYAATTSDPAATADSLCFSLCEVDEPLDDSDWQQFLRFSASSGAFLGAVDGLSGEATEAWQYVHVSNTEAVVLDVYNVVGALFARLRDSLHSVKYLGPLRAVPTRAGIRAKESLNRHTNGLSDWAEVIADPYLHDYLNEWLGPKRLNTGLRVETQRLYREEVVRDLMARASSGSVESVSTVLDGIAPESVAVVFRDVRREKNLGAGDVGVGFAQVLPVLIRALRFDNDLHLIEQPELHLHPSLQADLADAFITGIFARESDGSRSWLANRFILETHSEHFILRLLRRIRETSEGRVPPGLDLTPDDVCVYYALPGEKGTQLVEVEISEDGDFRTPWPDGFFPERLKELE